MDKGLITEKGTLFHAKDHQNIFFCYGNHDISYVYEELEGNLLTVDTFSTFSNNNPIDDQRFIWVDTVRKEWDYVN